ncbi:hypothetical protein LH61_04790 [Leuconostoc mesenteroides P45]|nr:hypothetical protein LH61_04790 [Leuconostoc mesenteroides P45]
MKLNYIKMWPIFLWLIVLNLSSDYINTFSAPEINHFIYYMLFQFILTFSIFWLRLNSYIFYVLFVGTGYSLLTFFAQKANVIYVLGLLPLILIDLWLKHRKFIGMTIFSLAIMSLMTMYALITIYSIVNILVIFDAIILLTGLLYYYTKVTRKIMESEQRNAYLVKQMDKLYVEMESMVSMREKERYAQDLHDSVTQDLIAIKLQLELVYNQLNTSIKTKCALKSLIDFTQRSVENARVQIANMKKDVKTVTNLSSDLLSNIIDKFEFEYQLSINSSIDDISLSNHIGVNLSSILNELLTNVVRHSRSSSVVVLFKKSDYGYDLSVIDFGIGMSTVRPRSEQHYGLQGITERVKNLNGHLTIESDMEEGTSVTASLPKGLFE